MSSHEFVNGTLREEVPLFDSAGNSINAHDGGILFVDGRYHWYGMALRPAPAENGPTGGQKTEIGVVRRHSPRLQGSKPSLVRPHAFRMPQDRLQSQNQKVCHVVSPCGLSRRSRAQPGRRRSGDRLEPFHQGAIHLSRYHPAQRRTPIKSFFLPNAIRPSR